MHFGFVVNHVNIVNDDSRRPLSASRMMTDLSLLRFCSAIRLTLKIFPVGGSYFSARRLWVIAVSVLIMYSLTGTLSGVTVKFRPRCVLSAVFVVSVCEISVVVVLWSERKYEFRFGCREDGGKQDGDTFGYGYF